MSNQYLIERHALYYAPSLSVLREMTKERVGKEREDSLIAFGNPVIGRDEQRNEELCPLPEAETEVTSVAKTTGSARSRVVIGREASERAFRTLARSCPYEDRCDGWATTASTISGNVGERNRNSAVTPSGDLIASATSAPSSVCSRLTCVGRLMLWVM